MYRKEDVTNIRNTDYELTELDERIYNETGYVIHQADEIFEYKEHFGTVYGQTVLSIHKNGVIESEEWYLDNECNHCFDIVDTPKKLMELAKLKYEELMNGYWKQ